MGNTGHQPVSGVDVKHLYALRLSINHGPKAYRAAMHSRKKDGMYDKVAEFCNAKSADPRSFIDWVFNVDAPLYPQPGMLMAERYTQSFISNGMPDVEFEKLRNRLESAMYRILRARPDEDLLAFLVNPLNEIPAVLTCAMADKLNRRDELPKDLVDLARSFVQLRPVYMARFSNLVPEWLR